MNYITLLNQLLPEAVLVVSALAVLGISLATGSKTLPLPLSLLGILLAGVALFYIPEGIDAGSNLIVIDPVARVFKGIVLGFAFLAILLPTAKKEIDHLGEYYALMLFAVTGLLLTVGSNHLLFLFVALELASLSLYLLAGFSRTRTSSEAAFKYFLFGGVSAAFFLMGLSFLYGFSHCATLQGVAQAVGAHPDSILGVVGLLMVLVGIGFKLAAAPFHYWAPDVYQGAPATSVALIAGASKAVGIVVLVRFLMVAFPAAAGSAAWGDVAPGWSIWLAGVAAISIVGGNLLALAQKKSVRRLLAYSAVSNTGYLLVGVAAHGFASTAATMFYVVVYGLATLGALAITASVEREKGSDALSSFAGLIHRSPLRAVALFIFMASLAGIPPLAGFAGKFILFGSALADSTQNGQPGMVWLVGLAAVMSAVSLYYYLSVLKQAFVCHDENKGKEDAQQPSTLPMTHRLVIALPAIGLVVLGLFPALLLSPIKEAVLATLKIVVP